MTSKKEEKSFLTFGILNGNTYIWCNKSRSLPIRTAYPAGHFFICLWVVVDIQNRL